MFPEETHQKIVKRLDEIEADLYGVYRAVERFRLDLQRQWGVLPSGERRPGHSKLRGRPLDDDGAIEFKADERKACP